MCQIISFGFTQNGNQSSGSCTGTTLDTIGAFVSISVEASDIGKQMMASVGLLWNGSPTGSYTYKSTTFTPSTGLLTAYIPFTGLTPKVGTYSFLNGCAYINAPDFSSQYCYSCSTLRCSTLTVSTPCTTPSCGFGLT